MVKFHFSQIEESCNNNNIIIINPLAELNQRMLNPSYRFSIY